MSTSIVARVRGNPKFRELVRRRTRLAVVLSAIVLVSYYSFMMLVAFNPAVLGAKLSENGVMTVGFPIGAAIIIVSWLLTGYYVYRANNDFDDLTEEIQREAAR